MGWLNSASVFASSSCISGVIVLVIIGGLFVIKDEFRALKVSIFLIIAGFSLVALGSVLFHLTIIPGATWIIVCSIGIYLGYVPFNCFLFERMIAAFKAPGNVGFLIYIADSFGYFGAMLFLLFKELIPVKYTWSHWFSILFYISSLCGILLMTAAYHILKRIYQKRSGL